LQHYKKLEERFAQVTALQQIFALIDWDKSVMMPVEGAQQRARQSAVLQVKTHETLTDPCVGEWLAAADAGQLDPWQAANFAMMQWHYTQATAVPAELIAQKMLQASKTEMLWRQAKQDSDFKRVAPELAALLAVEREIAAAKSSALGIPAYDSLMARYAPHMTSAEVDVIFDDMAKFIPPFVDEVLATQQQPIPFDAPVPAALQEKFGQQLKNFLGFDTAWGRLDVSAHPFSTGIGSDVRITTRYTESDFMMAIQGVTHEVGHGLYDHNTPEKWHNQPVGKSQNMGMAIHESQSLSLDMRLGRSREYWEFLAPHLQKTFGTEGSAWSGENLYRHAIQVKRGFIRIDADEVTYPAHIILRYRLEKDMVNGSLAVKDLPDAWGEGMRALLGVTPLNDRTGCLQDIHWYCGDFGYFPAYALGQMISAQFVNTMLQDIPDVFAQAAKGHFGAFTGWLKDNVHARACLHKPQELIEKVTGQKMSAVFLKRHLSRRYLNREYHG
jgi:carboxypeptidase Taq